MSETSPTPWRVKADTYVDDRHSGDTEGEFLAGWNIHAADGTEIVGCEGILGDGEVAANRIVHAVNCHAEMVEALKTIDDWWTDSFPQGPFAEDLSVFGGVGQLSGETVAIWQKIRSALARATEKGSV